MQVRRGPGPGALQNSGALQKATNARMRESSQRRGSQWVGHHTEDVGEINGASGVAGGYVGLYGGIVAALIGALTGDRDLYFFSLLGIIVVGFAYGVLSGGAGTRTMKATIGNSCLYGSIFSFVAIMVGVIVSIMVMVPVLMVFAALKLGRYG